MVMPHVSTRASLTMVALLALAAAPLRAQSTAPAPDNTLTAEEKKAGWILLFDGKSAADWTVLGDQTPCADAIDTAENAIDPNRCGFLVQKQEWSNFRLQIDYKVSPNANSGVFIRMMPNTDLGPEVQILDSKEAGFHDAGALYDLVKPTKNAAKPTGEWNHYEIVADKNLIDVWLNGEHVNHMDLDEWTKPNKRPDGTDHKFDVAWKDQPRTGFIGVQDHGDHVWFKNIKILPLK